MLIQEKVQHGTWKPVRISRNGPTISHLFFADDCILFTQTTSSQARVVKDVLDAFCKASGLKVNVQKTRFLASKNVSRAKKLKFSSLTTFQHTTNMGKYLGFPMLQGRVKKSEFTFLTDRIGNKLASWKSKLLGIAGRVTLAKSSIASIPIYSMQNNWIPTGTCNRLDACVKQFIWGDHSNHWVNWKTITQSKDKGGLGIRTAREANISMLGKHVWNLIHHRDKLWVKMHVAEYLKDANVLTPMHVSGMSPTWKVVVKTVDIIKYGFRFRLAKGAISIWYDKWLDEGYLCQLIPYVHILDSELHIKDVFFDGCWHWDLLATQIPMDIKLKMQNLFSDDSLGDVLIWGNDNSGHYSVKSAFVWLTQRNDIPDSIPDHSWSWIWKLPIPENIQHFLWLASRNSLRTNDFRTYRHLSNDSSCQRCGVATETGIHALRDCVHASRIWSSLHLFNHPQFFTRDFYDWISFFSTATHGPLFLVACWFIWKARNAEIFSDSRCNDWLLLNRIYSFHVLIIETMGKQGCKKTEGGLLGCST
ncbi:unnamed protein product [Lupinus luteus]|uniref:Uncharacterized protein n=1 Tax=Lupinus luteus TaxID=3873 RepID=A0AAV1VRQ2_LUPLU